jgi:hypothetical protein
MPKIRNKIWIDTTKSDQVEKHPKTAFLQKWRNKLLIWKNENINLKSARIGPPPTGRYGPTGDRVHKCLELLSKDLSEDENNNFIAAFSAIESLVKDTNWKDSLTKVLPREPDPLQQLRKNVKFLFTKFNVVGEQRNFLAAVYEKSDARLAGPKGYYHVDLDAPAEVLPTNNAGREANAGVGQAGLDVSPPADPPPPADAPPPPAAQVESASHGHASVQPDEIKPQDGSVEIKTNGQSAAPSTDEIVQPGEPAAGPSRDSIDAELDKYLHDLDSLAGTRRTEVRAQTPNTGQKGIMSSNPRVPRLQLPKQVQQDGTPLSTPRVPRPRLTSNAVEPKQKIQSARSPAPEKLPESKDADLNQVLKVLDSSNELRQAIPLALASEAMEPIVKVEDNGPPDNPATMAMPVTLSAGPSGEPSATVSAPSQPQVLSETRTEPLPEATPAPRPAGAQWTSKQEDAANRSRAALLTNRLMTLMKSDRLNLSDVFETLNKLAVPELQRWRADSMKLVDLPADSALEHLNNVMHSFKQDLDSNRRRHIPRMLDAKRPRVAAIVQEWQELGLTRPGARSLWVGEIVDVQIALAASDLTPPTTTTEVKNVVSSRWSPTGTSPEGNG